MAKVFMYVEYQISKKFDDVDVATYNPMMKEFAGLKSKTWLSGINTNSLGGFYEFDSKENAQNYIDNLLVPSMSESGCLSVKLFDGDIVSSASQDMNSPYY